MYDYENLRRVSYGDMVFIPVCMACGRFVKADATVFFNEETGPKKPNATCSKCGRIGMIFEGYFSEEFLV